MEDALHRIHRNDNNRVAYRGLLLGERVRHSNLITNKQVVLIGVFNNGLMNRILVAKSKSINIDLEYYVAGRSVVRGYLIKDDYCPPASIIDHGRYIIKIESPLIQDESDLCKYSRSIKVFAQRLTVLTKCVLGQALNTSPWETDSFTKRIELIGQMPDGWQSNYSSIQEELDKKKRLHLHIEEVEPHHFFTLNASPFSDYIKALKQYAQLKPIERDLLQVLNDADLVSFTGRYMLLSKALEIVNAMHPLKRTDDRIQILLPELVQQFNGATIKDMMNLANNRKETRHYVDKSKDTLCHQAMSEEELKTFYSFTNQLCLNLLRRSLGLDIVDFSME